MSQVDKPENNFAVTVYSFGFKHGYPEADMVLDVRFLPNPYWVEELKYSTGLQPAVAAYVLENRVGQEFLARLEPFLLFFLGSHQKAERKGLCLAVGCTGGQHRSVAVTDHLRRFLKKQKFAVKVFHRDLDKA